MNTFIQVESSNIMGLSYDKEKKEMALLFNGGSITIYKKVELDDFIKTFSAKSIGSHLHRFIKGNFAYVSIGKTVNLEIVDIKKQAFEDIKFDLDAKFDLENKLKMILTDVDFERDYAILPCEDDIKIYSGNVSVPDGKIGIVYGPGECPYKEVECNSCKGTGVRIANI